ncbi:MAG: SGNH/GDSL hydrolase family protein [bacterium]|nr:SGNH/GDSL hydrolase family protein [bacterium]
MRRAARASLFLAGFALALFATTAGIRSALDRAEIELETVTRHGVADYYNDRVAAYLEHGEREGDYRVAFLGDSMVVSYPQSHQIPALVQRQARRLRDSKERVQVYNLGLAGTGAFDYYFMADVVERLDPDLVIIEFNLASTSRDFQSAFSRPELSGWVGGARLTEAMWLPVNWIGLTFDRLLLYASIIRSGTFEYWVRLNEEQVRVSQAREQLAAWAATRNAKDRSPEEVFRKRRSFLLLSRNTHPGKRRHSAFATRNNLGTSLDGLRADDPTVRMLGAAIRTYRNFGADVLVYANPINVDHIESLGLLDRAGLDRSLAAIGTEVANEGGHFVDLHRLFPDRGFRDHSGHFTYEGEINGPSVLASKLAPLVVELMGRKQPDGT